MAWLESWGEMGGDFDLSEFLPYLLNRAAEDASAAFSTEYKERYGMLRTEWRVLFHLGRYGEMTAREICDRAGLHKTKVSRAVAALQSKRFLQRAVVETDKRNEMLSLTRAGLAAYRDLAAAAARYDAGLVDQLGPEQAEALRVALKTLIQK
jgi:DNA-binding MarR family transcriptional regulator